MEDPVHLDEQGVDDVVADELEIGVGEEMPDVVLAAGEEIVDADDVVALAEEALAEMAAQKSRAARDQDASSCSLLCP